MSCGCQPIQNPQVAYSNFACCAQNTYVQDQACTTIDIAIEEGTGAFVQDLYKFNFNPGKMYVTGTLKIDAAPTDRIIAVNFLLGATLVERDTIIPGTALAFTKTGFDTIQLDVGTGADTTQHITGELCVTVRYPVA